MVFKLRECAEPYRWMHAVREPTVGVQADMKGAAIGMHDDFDLTVAAWLCLEHVYTTSHYMDMRGMLRILS